MARIPAAVEAKKTRDKRAKILLAVLGVVLLGVAAFEVPSILKRLNQKPPPPPANALPPNGNPIPAPGSATIATPSLAAASTGAGGAQSSGVPAPAQGQLVSFGRFASKDPFAQQISGAPSSTGSVGAGRGGKRAPTPTSGPPPAAAPSGSSGPPPAAAPQPAPTSALISVNGAPEVVQVGNDFPSANPTFHLVSLTWRSAKISIVGGSYASGAATVTVRRGKPLTLENTADGTRYVIRLLALNPGQVAAGSSGTPSATPSTTTTTPGLTP